MVLTRNRAVLGELQWTQENLYCENTRYRDFRELQISAKKEHFDLFSSDVLLDDKLCIGWICLLIKNSLSVLHSTRSLSDACRCSTAVFIPSQSASSLKILFFVYARCRQVVLCLGKRTGTRPRCHWAAGPCICSHISNRRRSSRGWTCSEFCFIYICFPSGLHEAWDLLTLLLLFNAEHPIRRDLCSMVLLVDRPGYRLLDWFGSWSPYICPFFRPTNSSCHCHCLPVQVIILCDPWSWQVLIDKLCFRLIPGSVNMNFSLTVL
jgi:hypothetical protein